MGITPIPAVGRSAASLQDVQEKFTGELQRNFTDKNDPRLYERSQQLQKLARELPPQDAEALYKQLTNKDNPLSKLFKHRLATPTRDRILGSLKSRFENSGQAPAADSQPDRLVVPTETKRKQAESQIPAAVQRAEIEKAQVKGPKETTTQEKQGPQSPFKVVTSYPGGNGTVFELKFDEPKTREEVEQYLFKNGKVPTQYDVHTPVIENEDYDPNKNVALVPDAGNGKASSWKLYVPDKIARSIEHGLREEAADFLFSKKNNFQPIPPWVPDGTKEIISTGNLPGKGDPDHRLSVRMGFPEPRQNVLVWREGDTVTWLDKESGKYQIFRYPSDKKLEVLKRDMQHYVEDLGISPSEASEKFTKQWSELNRFEYMAFGMVLEGTHGHF